MEWIAVSEQLPEEDTPVLVTNLKWSDGSIDAALIHYDEEGWHWYSHHMGELTCDGSYEFDDDYEYTHWMPFPETPHRAIESR